MVSDWPRPNVLLSAIALGSLEQLGHSLEKQYPFLLGLVNEVGAAMYANFDQLAKIQDEYTSKNRFLVFFQHGRLWFQALAGEQQLNHSLQASDTTQRDEIERLTDALQEQKAAHLVEKMQDRVKRAVRSKEPTREDHHASNLQEEAACHSALPLLTRLLLHGGSDSADDVLATNDGSFQEFVREMARVFSSLNDAHALRLLRALLDSANADRDHKPLAELLAIAVDALDEPARREFLREYFAFVASDELQDALRERDESNDAKRLASFVDELFDSLGLDPSTSTTSSGSTTFHSDQARVIKSVLDRTELLQEIAAEFCFLDDETGVRALPEDLRRRLRAFETPARRILKAQQLMASSSSAIPSSKETSSPSSTATVRAPARAATTGLWASTNKLETKMTRRTVRLATETTARATATAGSGERAAAGRRWGRADARTASTSAANSHPPRRMGSGRRPRCASSRSPRSADCSRPSCTSSSLATQWTKPAPTPVSTVLEVECPC